MRRDVGLPTNTGGIPGEGMGMTTAVRGVSAAINWRITLLGLNLAAWLAGPLVVPVLVVHHEMTAPPLYPGFGYNIPMFTDFPSTYPLMLENEPVVGLK